jgi:hypothetical protein
MGERPPRSAWIAHDYRSLDVFIVSAICVEIGQTGRMVRICLLAAFVTTLFGAASTSSADQKRIASYCSQTGDLCFGIFEQRGVVTFELTTFARYFSRYSICVRPPSGATTCRSFPVKRRNQLYGGVVRWNRNFPNKGPGRYQVAWKQSGQRLGPSLRFRVAPLTP